MIFGGFEWVLIVLAILFLFGAKRIPELARRIGQGMREFRIASESLEKSQQEITDFLKYKRADKNTSCSCKRQ